VLRGACWRDVSIEPGGKGSFQAVKLQRPARTTVCSHSTRDMAARRSIESKQDHSDTQDECLSCCEQSPLLCACFTYSSLADDRIIVIYQASLSASLRDLVSSTIFTTGERRVLSSGTDTYFLVLVECHREINHLFDFLVHCFRCSRRHPAHQLHRDKAVDLT